MHEKGQLTAVDLEILTSLFNRKTLSLRGIPSVLGIPSRKFFGRVKHLHATGVIQGWPVVINPWATGGFRVFFFFIKTNPSEPSVLKKLLDEGGNYLLSLDGIAGEYSLLAKFSFSGHDEQQVLEMVSQLHKIATRARFQRYKIVEAISIYKHCGFQHDQKVRRLKDQEAAFLELVTAKGINQPLPPTTADLGAITGNNQSTVSRTLARLQSAGAVTSFSVRTSIRTGHNKFHVSLKVEPAVLPSLVQKLIQRREITSLYRTGEDYGLYLTVFQPNFESFSQFLKELYLLEGVIDSFSTPVLETEKESVEPLVTRLASSMHVDVK
ncbi:MAG: Lrp/AsnC ligand binding domain-containing protein [Candidatus Odinarchaeota archaeon]